MHMNGYVRLEKNPVIRAVPLEVKKYFLMVGAALGSRRITTVYSNIGVVRFPRNMNRILNALDFLPVRRRCSFVPALTEMSCFWDLPQKFPEKVFRGIFLNI